MSKALIQLNATMQQLVTLPIKQQIAALGEGLRVGQPDECQRFALRLIEIAGFGYKSTKDQSLGPVELLMGLSDRLRARHADAALRMLAERWGRLPMDSRSLALSLGRSRWIRVVRALGADPDPALRIGALEIARDTGDPALGVLVCSMLNDEHQQVRLSADRTLLAMVLGMFRGLERGMLGEEYESIRDRAVIPMLGDTRVLELERCAMLSAIADAAWSFADHRCRSPLLASLLLMDRKGGTALERRAFEKMQRLLSERNHPSHMPMRTVLRTTPAPVLRGRALRWLVIDPISGVASARLAVAESIEEHRAGLELLHLCIRPKRARALRKVRIGTKQESGIVSLERGAPVLQSSEIATLDVQGRKGAIRWMIGLGLDDSIQRRELEWVMADPDPLVRLNGCAVAGSLDVLDYLYDPSPEVARHAAMRWSSVGGQPPMIGSGGCTRRSETAVLNTRSGCAWVRRIAREEADRVTMEMPTSPSSRLAARRLLASDPARFVRDIRAMLRDERKRGTALSLILALGLEERFEMDLMALSNEMIGGGMDARIAASLVRGLSAIRSPMAREVVMRGLESDDQRVVANAIESVHTPMDVLTEYKSDTHHRVRSSALRRLIMDGQQVMARDAAQELSAMLHDERVEHRRAGVWASQRVLEPKSRVRLGSPWRDLVVTLHEMSERESDQAVRDRADRCVHRVVVGQRTADPAMVDGSGSDDGPERGGRVLESVT
ncbi:MAG: hypothetical protein JJ974_08990 [Phycisphaerales bacterium]|nr:hypothetical protein [Phycisphaerales bacterium]